MWREVLEGLGWGALICAGFALVVGLPLIMAAGRG